MTDLFFNLPASFQIPYTSKCSGCGQHDIKETINYELRIEPLDRYDRNQKRQRRYRIFYIPSYYEKHSKAPETIGVQGGGEYLEKCIEILQDKLKNIGIF